MFDQIGRNFARKTVWSVRSSGKPPSKTINKLENDRFSEKTRFSRFVNILLSNESAEAGSEPKKLLTRNTNLQDCVESYQKKVNAANFGDRPRGPKQRFDPPPAGVKNGVKLEMFPPAMSSAPFTYKDVSTGKQHEMAFFGGVSCLIQHASGAIEPQMGWAVLDSGRLKGEASAVGADVRGKGGSGKGDSAKRGNGYNGIRR